MNQDGNSVASSSYNLYGSTNETIVDTLVDSVTGGEVTPASVAASFAFNAVTEGITSKVGKGAKADVNTNKPKSGDELLIFSKNNVNSAINYNFETAYNKMKGQFERYELLGLDIQTDDFTLKPLPLPKFESISMTSLFNNNFSSLEGELPD